MCAASAVFLVTIRFHAGVQVLTFIAQRDWSGRCASAVARWKLLGVPRPRADTPGSRGLGP